jgi:hypothetical protein
MNKPIQTYEVDGVQYFTCPICGCTHEIDVVKPQYCANCGVKLNFNEKMNQIDIVCAVLAAFPEHYKINQPLSSKLITVINEIMDYNGEVKPLTPVKLDE